MADQSPVSPITEDIVTRGVEALYASTQSRVRYSGIEPTEEDRKRAQVKAVLSAALAGRTAEPDEDERQTLMRILDKHLDSPDMADWERRDRASKARLYADRILAAGYRRVAGRTVVDLPQREQVWDIIATVRDGAERTPQDAETDDIIDALVDGGVLRLAESAGGSQVGDQHG